MSFQKVLKMFLRSLLVISNDVLKTSLRSFLMCVAEKIYSFYVAHYYSKEYLLINW